MNLTALLHQLLAPGAAALMSAAGAAAMLVTAGAAAQTPDAATLQLRSLAATCAACHGTEGQAQSGDATVPLVGLQGAVIAEQMRAFRDGKRPATVMHQLTKGYSDAQIDALAAYFAARK